MRPPLLYTYHPMDGPASLLIRAAVAAMAVSVLTLPNPLWAQEVGSDFASHFAEFEAIPAYPAPADGVVDITSFEPPIEGSQPGSIIRSLGMGVASYYGRRFHGRLTANGERFNMNAMTAAHKSLRFGTKVRVTNPRNGKFVVVRINDRGPFIRGRTIDLSREAARRIGMISSGHARVKLDIVK